MNPRRFCSALAAIAAGILGLGLLGPEFGVREQTAPGPVQKAAKPPSPPALARKPPSPLGPSPRRGAPLAPVGAGHFLVASRALSGPFFRESIVLVLEYSALGAVGLVVNRPTDAALGELIPEVARLSPRHDRVYQGGPVDPNVMTFLIRSEAPVAGGVSVAPGVYATPNAEALSSVIRSGTPASHFRAFVGYSGWGPGQLDRELARGDWHVGPARPEVIFDDAPGDLWPRVVVEFEGIQVRQKTGNGRAFALRGPSGAPPTPVVPLAVMLDPRILRDQRDAIVDSCRHRNVKADVDQAIAAQDEVTALRTELNDANRVRNEHQKAGKRPMDDAERKAHVEEGRSLKESVSGLESRLRESEQKLEDRMMELPNFIHPSVPLGGEDDYRVVQEGTPKAFDFEPLDHLTLCEKHDLVDFEAGAKVAGQKFYYLKNEAALLDLALQRFALEHVIEAGFTPMATPDLARPAILTGLGFNPRGQESQIYSIENHDLCLVGTAEITLGGLGADRILDEADLPMRVAGISHCFRTEAGAHGRESKGLYRVHQFSKTEMFVFCRPEDSEAELDRLLGIEQKIFDALEIPYRVIDIASGDLGAPAYRKFDIEAWMPGRGENGSWGEVTSASNCTDFQARRLKTRYRKAEGGKPEIVHTLNGTALSNARAILALVEIHQRADGSIGIPQALIPFLGRDSIGPG